MSVSEILNEIEDLVVAGRHIPFIDHCVLNEDDLIRLIDELRSELPMELQRASEIVSDRDGIISRAQQEADRIVEEAKVYANRLVDASEIKQTAEKQARQIVDEALAQEKEIRERTMKDTYQLRDNADQYANQVFDNLIGNVGSALNILEQAKKELTRTQLQHQDAE